MAVRRATRRYEDLGDFFRDYEGSLQAGAILLPAGTVDGELAPQIKLDLIVPLKGRVGPFTAQVVHRAPSGDTALQLPAFASEGGEALAEVAALVAEVEAWLRASGRVRAGGEAPDADARDARIAELEARVAELEAAAAGGGPVPAAMGAEAAPAAQAPPTAASPAEPAAAPETRGRGLRVPDLRGVAPTLSGELGDAFRDAAMNLTVQRATGLLTVDLPGGRVRYGFWSRGGPVGWRTDPLDQSEVLGVLLYKAGQLTREQLQASVARMQETGVRQGEALMDMGLVGFSQLTMILGKQVEFVFTKVLRETEGTWTFHALDELTEDFLPPPLRVPSLVYRGLVQQHKALPGAQLADLLRPQIDRYLHFHEDRLLLLNEIKFSAPEVKLLETMQSRTWRTREVLSVSPLSKQNTAAILMALIDTGFLYFEGKEDTARYLGRVGQMLERKRRNLMKATHFDVLEVHWISLPGEIEAGYRRQLEQYDPARYPDIPAEMRESLEYIRRRLKESFDVLREDARRREHRKEILEPMMILQSADLLAKKGEMAIMRKDRREATTCFAKALELAPGHPEYRDGLARASAIV